MAVNPPKCWKSITFTGSDEFVTCAMREARDSGIEIIAVGDTQLEILAMVMSEGRSGMGSMVGFAAAPESYDDPVLAPFWETVQDLDMPLAFHVVARSESLLKPWYDGVTDPVGQAVFGFAFLAPEK